MKHLPLAAAGGLSRPLAAAQDDGFAAVASGTGWAIRAGSTSAQFTARTVRIGAGASIVSLSLSGIGSGLVLRSPGPARLSAAPGRVSYRYRELESWYAGRRSGLEQGFTVPRPLNGAASGTLLLAFRLGGASVDLLPVRRAVSIVGRRGVVAHYGGLVARDARGRLLRSWLGVSRGRLLIEVAAGRAAYPVRIDPLIQAGAFGGTPGTDLGALALSGNDLFARSLASAAPPPPQRSPGGFAVFSKPASGWQNATQGAELVASDGAYLTAVAASGGTVVALAPDTDVSSDANNPGALYVFTEPAAGWAGTVQQSAKLVSSDPDCVAFTNVAISGSTIAASCSDDERGDYVPNHSEIVFSEPVGGWLGTQTQSATLVASDQAVLIGPIAVSGSTVFTGGESPDLTYHAIAFTEPPGGWSGTVKPSASLVPFDIFPESVPEVMAVSGNTLFAAGLHDDQDGAEPQTVFVYDKPSHGWLGTLHPAAQLKTPFSGEASLAASGRTLAVSQVGDPAGDVEHGCPCYSNVAVFREPARGWSGTLGPQATASFVGSDPAGIALQDQTLFAGTGDPTIRIFSETSPAFPAVSGFGLTGLKRDRPRIEVQVTARSTSLSVSSVTFALPGGLRFSSSHKRLTAGIAITGRHNITLSRGKLTVKLSSARSSLGLAVSVPGLIESRGLQRAAQHATRRSPVRVKIHLVITDTAGGATNRTLTQTQR